MSIPTSLHAARELFRVKASGNEFVLLVHAATNEEPWGPTGTQMDEVCRAFARGSFEIMDEIKLRLKNRDKSWRPCYKSLLLLDHLARNVPESGLPAICSVIPMLRNISQTFYYTGRKGTDHGLSVRERAKKLCDLLSDGAVLREEREKAALTRFKLSGASGGGVGGGGHSNSRYQGYSSSMLPPSALLPSAYETQTQPTRTKEEQERYDMELAARLQREEEMRAGMSAVDVERMFNRQVPRQAEPVAQAARNSDLELARRLQEEEDQKLHGRRVSASSSPAQGTSTGASAMPPSPTPATPSPKPEPQPPKKDVLDDLFAPAPLTTTTTTTTNASAQQPGWANSAPLQQQPPTSADPFDAFLDTRIQQQQQQQYPQQVAYGSFPPSMAPPQQFSGMMAGGGGGGGWNGAPQPSMTMPADGRGTGWSSGAPAQPSFGGLPTQASWGAPSATGNVYAPTGAQGVPLAANGTNNTQGWASFTSAGAAANNTSSMEEQMAHFSGQVSGHPQPSAKSLNALMAERRGME
ncbi:epsin [Trypanosoma conorhini]|uniref:Epsin n=1 Tax=Trypanosoma conorhini TaxID=83891 RepID=A0A3R7P7E2_9TRYP|nr:epsin [Trypanosoma conorhini]RNF18683.1 epsin [Trypanosoma conorhini]